MTITPETIIGTQEYQKIKDPVKQKFLRNKQSRDLIGYALVICKNRGYDYWNQNFQTSDSVRRIVRELYQREISEETNQLMSEIC